MSLHQSGWSPFWLHVERTHREARGVPLWLFLLLVAAAGTALMAGGCALVDSLRGR